MDIVIDSGVFIQWERSGRTVDFNQWVGLGNAHISAITASELLMGVHRADGPERRMRRQAFVEKILLRLPILEINLGVARVHSTKMAELASLGTPIGSHDLWIAATAIFYDCAVLTLNANEFERVSDLTVLRAPRS